MEISSSLHYELNSNYRRKIAKRERRQPAWSSCHCGGITVRGKHRIKGKYPNIHLHECFRPGGPSCKRRATRSGWRHSSWYAAMGIPEEE